MTRNYEGLDALRGVAALTVLAHHLAQTFPSFRPFQHFYLGVDLFFMISGFVIGLVYEEKLAEGRLSFGDYARIRLVRLYPLILLGVLLGLGNALIGIDRPPGLAAHVAAQLLVLPALWSAGPLFPLNSPQWSLFFELAINAFHGLVVRLLSLRVLVVLLLLSLLFYVLGMRHYGLSLGWQRQSFLGGFPRTGFGFFTGLLLYRLAARGRLPARVRHAWLALPAFVAVVATTGYFPEYGTSADSIAVFVLFPAIVAAAAAIDWPESWRPVTMAIGALSYAVYAIQAPLIRLAASRLEALDWWPRLAGCCAVGAAIIALAWLADLYWDQPLRAILRRRLLLPSRTPAVTTAP